jgi:serine/threonine protein kinase/tetratricopeptide (TPR) repeat protein
VKELAFCPTVNTKGAQRMSGEAKLENPGMEDTLALPQKAGEEAPPEPDTGRQIGPYRLLRVIGEGGMGEVWLAEQSEPRRKVALKLIKAGMDTKQVVARFDSERQALALMDHPAIAKVFDGGSTPEGRPYFVMEYVAGVPITEHCDTHKLSTTARLELFTQVCEGVQHAHQKAIIHRDLKPSNILVSTVDGKPQVKIIDFGIAKATGNRLTEKTLFTELGAIIGTPEYMSPEQADLTGQDIDTRTDVYALGVVLYQLLTGELPFTSQELRSSSYDELRRKLREVEPPRPSTKLSTLGDTAADAAIKRDTNPGALRHQLEGDLDAITMKALEKERDRRYGSPSELAQDIGRHLRNEPVVARAAGTAYRLRKYVARHRLGVGLATGLAALLVAVAVAMGVQARRIAVERDRAIHEQEATEKTAKFLANMLSGIKPRALGNAIWKDLHQRAETVQRAKGASDAQVAATLASLDGALAGVNPTQTAQQVLDEQILEPAGKTVEQIGDDPRLAGWLEQQLGRTYANLGLYKQAEEHDKRALDIETRGLGRDDLATQVSLVNLAALYSVQGRYPEAEKLLLESLAAMRNVDDPRKSTTRTAKGQLASIYTGLGRHAEAEKLFLENLELMRKFDGPEARSTLETTGSLSALYILEGHFAEGEQLLRENVKVERRVFGPENTITLRDMSSLAAAIMEQGRYADAEKSYRELLEVQRSVLGPQHPLTLTTMNNLASVYWNEGKYTEAEQLLQEAIAGMQKVYGPEHANTLATLNTLGNVYADEKRYPDAERVLRETLETQRRVLAPDHPLTVESAFNLAAVYNSEGRYAEAEQLARGAVSSYERTKFKDGERVGGAHVALGNALLGLTHYPEAEKELLEAEHLFSTVKGVPRQRCLEALVALYGAWDKATPGAGHAAQAAAWKAKLSSNG